MDNTTITPPQPKKKGRPRKIRTPEELAEIEAKKKSRLTLAQKQQIKLEQQHKKQEKQAAEPQNTERFYCTNKELHRELLAWRNSGNSIYKVMKMVGNKVVPTEITQTPEQHEKYEEGTNYVLVYPVTDKRYELVIAKGAKFLKKYAGNVTEDVTEQVKNMGWAFDIDDPITDRKMSDKLGKMFMDIGNKLLNHSSFRNYDKELKDDMLMFGIEKVIKGLNNYNFKFNNPFAWITQAFWNAYLSVLNRHYKQINIRKDLMIKLSQELETFSGINPSSGLAKCIKTYLGNDVEID